MAHNNTDHLRVECEPFHDGLYKARAIFRGESLFSRVLPFTLLQLCIFSLISRTLYRFLKPLRQTEFVCNLLTGMLLGPSALGMYEDYARIKDSAPHLLLQNFAAGIGLTYHFFIIGVKTDAHMMLRMCKKKVCIIGMCSFVVPFLTLMYFMGFHSQDIETQLSIIVTCMNLSTTSFVNIAPVLDEFNLLTTTLGQVSLSASIVSEVVLWGFFLAGILNKSIKDSLLRSLFPVIMIVAFTIYILQPSMQWVVANKMSNGQKGNQIYFVIIFLWAAIIGVTSDLLVGAAVLGTAFFGLVVPKGPPLGSAIVNKSEIFIKHCFLPFFYMEVGDIINIYDLRHNWEDHLKLQFKIVIGYMTKTLATALPAIAYKMSTKQAFALGLVLNSSGDNHTIMLGLRLKLTGQSGLASQLLLSSIVITMLVTPFTIFFHKKPKKFNLSSTRKLQLPTLMSSKMNILACVSDKNEVSGIITLLNASNPTKSSPVHVHVVHLTEHVVHTTPTLLSHRKHRSKCKHNGCVDIVDFLDQYCCDHKDDNFVVRIFTMIAASKNMHDGICMLANDQRFPNMSLIIVPFLYKNPCQSRLQFIPNDINHKILAQAPCTVGILVDRGIGDKQQGEQCFSCHIAVIFFGGEDDREALSYAIRMLGHPGVIITVLRIHVHNFDDVIDQEERQFDEQSVDVFRNMMFNKASGNLHEIHVKDWFDAVKVIRSINNGYDLVMVGRRHGETSVQESEMSVLSENPELGHIGEMLISTDFQHGTVSVLVMQYQNMDHDKDSLGSLMFLEDE